jgi:hypothetical protein
MGFTSLEFAYFDYCESGHLKINSADQLVEGREGQIGEFDGPHSDMSWALGMASTIRDCAYQGWYDKPNFNHWLFPPTKFQKWTRDEWTEFSLGQGVSNLSTAIDYANWEQPDIFDINSPVNTYRLKGHGNPTAISLHQ